MFLLRWAIRVRRSSRDALIYLNYCKAIFIFVSLSPTLRYLSLERPLLDLLVNKYVAT